MTTRFLVSYRLFLLLGLALSSQGETNLPELPEAEIYYQVPTDLPVWLEGHEGILPPIKDDIIKEVAKLLSYRLLITSEGGEPRYEGFAKAIFARFAELKEKATYSVLSLYTYEDSLYNGSDRQKGLLVALVQHDPTITKYTLPLFRTRLDYINAKFRAGELSGAALPSEMTALLKYVLTWGDESDKRKLRTMLELLEDQGRTDYVTNEYSKELWKIFRRETESEFPGYIKSVTLREPVATWELLSNMQQTGASIETTAPKPDRNADAFANVRPLSSPPSAVTQLIDNNSIMVVVLLLVIFLTTGVVVWLLRQKFKQ